MIVMVAMSLLDQSEEAHRRIRHAQQSKESTLILAGLGISSIPEIIWELKNLEFLYIHQNQITEIPEEISRLTNLRHLIADENQLAAIPDAIGRLISLQGLGLRSNKLTALPDSIGSLGNL
jgi:internalin A